MPPSLTRKGLKLRVQRFLAITDFDQLARLLRMDSLQLLNLSSHPVYREFRIPKKNGKLRLIEDPVPALKKVQRKLNDYLQAVYYFGRTGAAYGFMYNPKGDPEPRHILSNAERHLGCRWLLNVDMQDFFHLISFDRIKVLFRSHPFGFAETLSEALAGLCCYRERLPMGAPTSPVLSNLVSIDLDQTLEDYACRQGWTYTRYADDMTFSSQSEIEPEHLCEIDRRVQEAGFLLNPDKVKSYGPEHADKEVTGLLVGAEEVSLPEDYLSILEKAIQHLDQVVDAKHSMPSGKIMETPWVRELQQQVRGRLEFARQILGEDDADYLRLEDRYWQALEPPVHYGPLTWLEFGYALPH